MIGALPETLSVGGRDYAIRTDYRNVLSIFEAFLDPELDDFCKNIVMLYMLFEEFSGPDDVYSAAEQGFDLVEAVKQAAWFFAAGKTKESQEHTPTYDWIQDEQMIFSAINKVAGKEVRIEEYMHWWTFLGYFNEIEEGIFSHVVGIRKKLNEGKKLEKWEQEFYRKNKDLIVIKKKLSAEEEQAEKEYQDLLSRVLG